jgi:hypothetical protein
MLKKIILSLCALAILSGQCYAGPAAYNFGRPGKINAGVRSLVLPGWGQFFNTQKTKGYVVGSAALLTLAGAYLFNVQADNTYTDYQNAGVKNSTLYSDYQTQQNQAMVISYLCAGIWVYGVIDACINGKGKEPKAAKSSAFFSIACNRDRSGLYLSQRF